MPSVKLPLSGDVSQQWATMVQNMMHGQFGLLNVNVGDSAAPEVEKAVLDVASYGRQLGRIGEALEVLLKHVKLSDLSSEETDAIEDLNAMLREIAKVKKRQRAR